MFLLFVGSLVAAALATGGIMFRGHNNTSRERSAKKERQEAEKAALEEQERIRRLIEESRPPAGMVKVCQNGIKRRQGLAFSGPLHSQMIGSPGMTQGLAFLHRLEQSDLLDVFGWGLVANFDKLEVERFQDQCPKSCRDRITYIASNEDGGGMSNLPYEEAKRRIGNFGVEVQRKAQEAILKHRRYSGALPSEFYNPSTLGGHLAVGLAAAQVANVMAPTSMIIAVFDLPEDEPMRNDLLVAKPDYDAAGVAGYIVKDALEFRTDSMDTALTDLVVGIYAQSLQHGKIVRLNNLVRRVAPAEPGGVVLFQYLHSQVIACPFQPHHSVPTTFYVNQDDVAKELRRLIAHLEDGHGLPSARMPMGEPGRATFDVLLAAVNPSDLLPIKEMITESRKLEANVIERPHSFFQHENYHTVLTSYCPRIDPSDPFCEVGIIRVQALTDWKQNLPKLVLAPRKRTVIPEPTKLPKTSTNGKVTNNGKEPFPPVETR